MAGDRPCLAGLGKDLINYGLVAKLRIECVLEHDIRLLESLRKLFECRLFSYQLCLQLLARDLPILILLQV